MNVQFKSKLLIVLILLVVSIQLSNKVLGKQTNLWRGYLIDRQCMKAVAASSNALDFVFHHTKDCVLMPSCIKDGFTLYLPKKKRAIDFDSKSNKLVEKTIRESKRNSAFWVIVEGKIVNGLIRAKSIKEIENKNKSKLLK